MIHDHENLHIQLTEQLRARVGCELEPQMWSYICAQGFVEQVETSKKDLAWLCEQVVELLEATGQTEKLQVGRKEDMVTCDLKERTGTTCETLSLLLGKEAAKDPGVIKFRKKYLRRKLLTENQVERWLKRKSKGEGNATLWLEIPLPPGCSLNRDPQNGQVCINSPPGSLHKHGVRNIRTLMLSYAVPGSTYIHRVPIAAGGALEALRNLGEALAKKYGWLEVQATEFVLTGQTPLVSPLRATVTTGRRGRVTLDVDITTTPAKVAGAYTKIRETHLTGKRVRSLSEKHLRLAAFSAERPEKESWRERLVIWNKTYFKDKYTSERNFHRDSVQATRRLLAPSLALSDVANRSLFSQDLTQAVTNIPKEGKR